MTSKQIAGFGLKIKEVRYVPALPLWCPVLKHILQGK